MPNQNAISRRRFLRTSGALGAAGLVGAGWGGLAQAEAPLGGVLRSHAVRGRLGGFEITTVLDGVFQLDGPHPIFGQDQDADTVAALLTENFLPADRFEIGFAPVIVNTGREVVLFDAGNGADRAPTVGHLRARMAAAGLAPEAVDVVVITHFHPDHIGGLMVDGAPAFPNARYVSAAAEFDFWMAEDRMSGPTERVAGLARSRVAPMAERIAMIADGQDVVSGITAVAAHGHTPGHTAYHIESDGRRLMIIADACNHFVVSMQRPDWHVRFDMDKAAAAETRKRLLGMIAADRIPFAGYHMPFPSIGYLEPLGPGYRYIPSSYQLAL